MEKSIIQEIMKINNYGRVWGSNYFVYILTNYTKTTLYIGVTNDLKRRIWEHYESTGDTTGFTKRYKCRYLVYWERFNKMGHAINREKQIKKWRREKKDNLVSSFNPAWDFLNDSLE